MGLLTPPRAPINRYDQRSSSPLQFAPSASVLRTFAWLLGVLYAYRYLHETDAPVAPFACGALSTAAGGLLVYYKPWRWKNIRWPYVITKGVLLSLSLLLLGHFIKRAGPVRVLLCERCGAILLPALLSASMHSPRRCLVACAAILLALVLLEEARSHTTQHDHGATAHGHDHSGGGGHAGASARRVGFKETAASFLSGLLSAFATTRSGGAASSAAASAIAARAQRQRSEQPLVVAAAAGVTLPLAAWELLRHKGRGFPDPDSSVPALLQSPLAPVLAMALAVVAALARGGSGKGAAAAGGGGAANGLMGFAAVLCLLDLRLPHRTGATSILVSASLMALAVRLLARKPPKDLPLSASAASFSSSSGSLAALASGVGGEAAWAQYRDAGARWAAGLPLPHALRVLAGGVAAFVLEAVTFLRAGGKHQRVFWYLSLNFAYMAVEFVHGYTNNSIGLLSDACHMLFDSTSIAFGLYAVLLARRAPDDRFHYGLSRVEVLSGFANGVCLVFVALHIIKESFERLLEPAEVSTSRLMLVSLGGLVVNLLGLTAFHEGHAAAHGGGGCCGGGNSGHSDGQACGGNPDSFALHPSGKITAMWARKTGVITLVENATGAHMHTFMGHRRGNVTFANGGRELRSEPSLAVVAAHGESGVAPMELVWDVATGELLRGVPVKAMRDHNMRAMFLHVLADTLGSVGMIISTVFVQWRVMWVDPLAAGLISCMILGCTVPLLQQSAETLLQRTPRVLGEALLDALEDIRKLPGVEGIGRCHFWAHTPEQPFGSMSVFVSPAADKQAVLAASKLALLDAGIEQSCVQIEEREYQVAAQSYGAFPTGSGGGATGSWGLDTTGRGNGAGATSGEAAAGTSGGGGAQEAVLYAAASPQQPSSSGYFVGEGGGGGGGGSRGYGEQHVALSTAGAAAGTVGEWGNAGAGEGGGGGEWQLVSPQEGLPGREGEAVVVCASLSPPAAGMGDGG